MSAIETILSRAMNDAEFADLLFNDLEKALADYDLSVEEIETLKNTSRTEFRALNTEVRLSMGKLVGNVKYNDFNLR